MKSNERNSSSAIGLDVGTSRIVVARQAERSPAKSVAQRAEPTPAGDESSMMPRSSRPYQSVNLAASMGVARTAA